MAFEVPLLLDLAGAPQPSLPAGLPVLVMNGSQDADGGFSGGGAALAGAYKGLGLTDVTWSRGSSPASPRLAGHDRKGQTVSALPGELRSLIESGPMVHLSTINPDGSPQVTVIWIGLDGDDLVSGHMSWHMKLRNMERDPRVVLSFDAPRVPGAFMNKYAVLRARATVEPGEGAWHLLNRLARVYVAPDAEFPAPPGPGYVVRYSVERIGGVGPWRSVSQ